MDQLKKYQLYLIRKGLQPLTVQKHSASLSNIQKQIGTLDSEAVDNFLLQQILNKKSPGHINNMVQALRHYGEFISDPSYKNIKFVPVIETTKGILSDEEIIALYSITPEEMETFLRNESKKKGRKYKVHINHELFLMYNWFFFILAHTGLRPKELATLRVSQVDWGGCVIRIDGHSKTKKTRSVAINHILKPRLEEYLKQLQTETLFPKLDRHQWKDQFNNRKRYLEIKRDKVTTYSLRFSWVTRLLDEGANPHVMSEMAGHSLEQQAHYYKLTTKSKHIAINKDPLARDGRTYEDRFKDFREDARKSLATHAKNIDEEQQMLHDLLKNYV